MGALTDRWAREWGVVAGRNDDVSACLGACVLGAGCEVDGRYRSPEDGMGRGAVQGFDRVGFAVRMWPVRPVWKGVRAGRIGDEIAGQGCARIPARRGLLGHP